MEPGEAHSVKDNRKPSWVNRLGTITATLCVILISGIMIVALAIILVLLVNFLGDLIESV